MRSMTLLSFLILLCNLCSGQVELVNEFFAGPNGTTVYTDFAGTYNQNVSLKLNNQTIVFSAKGEFGQELYKIEDGQLSLIKDLKAGVDDSNPQFLTQFDSLI